MGGANTAKQTIQTTVSMAYTPCIANVHLCSLGVLYSCYLYMHSVMNVSRVIFTGRDGRISRTRASHVEGWELESQLSQTNDL